MQTSEQSQRLSARQGVGCFPRKAATRYAVVLLAATIALSNAAALVPTVPSGDLIFADGFELRAPGCASGLLDVDDDGLLDLGCITAFDPPDPASIATPIDPTIITSFPIANGFLYDSPTPVQAGVAPGTMQAYRVSVLRGRVLDGSGQPLAGALVRVLDHPELGYTYSRSDGNYDLAVNGGGEITVDFRKDSFLRAQRTVATPWNNWVKVSDVALVALDSATTAIAFNATAGLRVHRANVVIDAAGTRRATLMFPSGTMGHMVRSDGSEVPLTTLHVRATEYTVGAIGPARMPGQLPPTSGYTYAVEFSADEAQAENARRIEFDRPLPVYMENHLGFPVGVHIPVGYYDFRLGSWLPSRDGRVIKILADVGAMASLDVEGNGQAADAATLAALGVTDEERLALLQLYAVGQVLWRTEVQHFTPWDHNHPYGPPTDATAPVPPLDPPSAPEPPDDPIDPTTPTNPPDEGRSDLEDPEPCEASGSVIDCSNDDLGETLQLPGTRLSLNYRSERMPGSNPQRFRVRVNVTGASIPERVKRVLVRLRLGGHDEEFELDPPLPNTYHDFDWDGKDAYGRTWQGEVLVQVDVGYVYDATYYATVEDLEASFASLPSVGGYSIPSSREIGLWTTWWAIGQIAGRPIRQNFFDARGLSFGGWSLSGHHVLDPAKHILYQGDGTTRRLGSGISDSLVTIEPYGDLPESTANVATARGVDGSIYKLVTPAEDSPRQRIVRQRPGSSSEQVLAYSCTASEMNPDVCGEPPGGAGEAWRHGTALQVDSLDRVVLLADSGLYRLSPPTYTPQSLPGIETCNTQGISLQQTRLLLICGGTQAGMGSIRMVWPDGQVTTLTHDSPTLDLGQPSLITTAPSGDLYYVDMSGPRIRRLATSGELQTVAGTVTAGFAPDGAIAKNSPIGWPTAMTVKEDGTVLFADGGRIRAIQPNGQLRTLLGGGSETLVGVGQSIGKRVNLSPTWIDTLPDGSVLFNEQNRVFRSGGGAFRFSDNGSVLRVPSGDGSEVFEFDPQGRHLRTLNATTGGVVRSFDYNATGNLIGIVDGDNNRTVIEWSGGVASAIVSPYGVRTTLDIQNKLLLTLSSAESQHWNLGYHPTLTGLLTRFERPLGYASTFEWDPFGRLRKDTDAEAGFVQLELAQWYSYYASQGDWLSALNRHRHVEFHSTPNGETYWMRQGADGSQFTSVLRRDGRQLWTSADGSSTTAKYEPDPRFGLDAGYVASQVTQVSALGPVVNTQRERGASAASGGAALGNFDLTDTVTRNGRAFHADYAAATRTWTLTSPENRMRLEQVDALGRLVRREVPGVEAIAYHYDSHGRLDETVQGEGFGARHWIFGYDTHGYLSSVTDPSNRTIGLARDAVGRVRTQTLPDLREIGYDYDDNDNLTSITPPGRPMHVFHYDHVDRLKTYTPPTVAGAGTIETGYIYNPDRQLETVARPDGFNINPEYDATTGRLDHVSSPDGDYGYSWLEGGRLEYLTTPESVRTDYAYHGPMLIGVTTSASPSANVGFDYDNDLRLHHLTVGNSTVEYGYDLDGLLTSAKVGDVTQTLTHDVDNGLLRSTELGRTSDTWGYNGFAEPRSYAAKLDGGTVFQSVFGSDAVGRDALGRIVDNTETVDGATHLTHYDYDVAGRLDTVTIDGVLSADHGYDTNSNRTSVNIGAASPLIGKTWPCLGTLTGPVSVTGSADDQDRLTSYGSCTFTYGANGELKSRSDSLAGEVTTYDYNVFGDLRHVTLPGGANLDFVIDGQHRRIGKKRNGVTIQGFVYANQLNPVAELDGAGNTIATFIYAERTNVPAYILKGGNTYRVIADHLGGPRLVIDTVSGAIVQRMDYDEWGNVVLDSNPGFQPFGFGGGIHDRDLGLIRFGARDYDPISGRWTSKDSALFRPLDVNLYRYSRNDPVNKYDRNGHDTNVVINDNAPLWGAHAGAQISRSDEGGPLLYDPSGSYKSDERGTGGVFGDEEAKLGPYLDYQKGDGPDVELFTFKTSEDEEKEIGKRFMDQGDPRGLNCASSVSDALDGIGPFKNLGHHSTPRSLKHALEQISIEQAMNQ